jgi:DNA-binding HxlR family transcriptional regulator
MKRTPFAAMSCPIARSLERVGEWWSILILRDAQAGLSRFDEFECSLGIASNMLARRLAELVESGLMEKLPYSERPRRYDYVLTERGRDFREVVQALLAWGNRHFAPEGPIMLIVDRTTGVAVEPILVDRISGKPLADPAFETRPGPALGDRGIVRQALIEAARARHQTERRS